MTSSQNGNKIFGAQLSEKQREELKQALIQKLGGPDGGKPVVEYRVNFDIDAEKFEKAQATFKNGIDANLMGIQSALTDGGRKLESAATLFSGSINSASAAATENARKAISYLSGLQKQLIESETTASGAVSTLATGSSIVANFNKLAIEFSANLHATDDGLNRYTAIKDVLGEIAPKIETLIQKMNGLDSKNSEFDETTRALNAQIASLSELDSTVGILNSTLVSIQASANRVRASSTEFDSLKKYFQKILEIAKVFNQIDEKTKDMNEASAALVKFNETISGHNYRVESLTLVGNKMGEMLGNWKTMCQDIEKISNLIVGCEEKMEESALKISSQIRIINDNVEVLESKIAVVDNSTNTLSAALAGILIREKQLIGQNKEVTVVLENIRKVDDTLTNFIAKISGVDVALKKIEQARVELGDLNNAIPSIDVTRFEKMISALENVKASNEDQEVNSLKKIEEDLDRIFGKPASEINDHVSVLDYLDLLQRRLRDSLDQLLSVLPFRPAGQDGTNSLLVDKINSLNEVNIAIAKELGLARELEIEEKKSKIKTMRTYETIGRKFSKICGLSEDESDEGKIQEHVKKSDEFLLNVKNIVADLDGGDLSNYEKKILNLKNKTIVFGCEFPIRWLKISTATIFPILIIAMFFIYAFIPPKTNIQTDKLPLVILGSAPPEAKPAVDLNYNRGTGVSDQGVIAREKEAANKKIKLVSAAVDFTVNACIVPSGATPCPVDIKSKIESLRLPANEGFRPYVVATTCKNGSDKNGHFCLALKGDKSNTSVLELCAKPGLAPVHKRECAAQLERAFAAYAVSVLTADAIGPAR